MRRAARGRRGRISSRTAETPGSGLRPGVFCLAKGLFAVFVPGTYGVYSLRIHPHAEDDDETMLALQDERLPGGE